jgi:hypothetical protein
MVPVAQVAPLPPLTSVRERGEFVADDEPRLRERYESDHPSRRDSRAPARSSDIFSAAYARAGKPRMAVYVNRELSDEVREWAVVGGWTGATSGSVELEYTGADGKTERLEGRSLSGAVANRHVGPTRNGRRYGGSESWSWRFEQGFLQPLLAEGAHLVDRTAIVRGTAARSAANGPEYATLAVKKVEMDALDSHADVIVEVLVTGSSASRTGYRFKASAREVSSGRILAVVVSEDGGLPRERGFVPTSNGYAEVERYVGKNAEIHADANGYHRHVELPGIEDVSSGLAGELMDALAAAWG